MNKVNQTSNEKRKQRPQKHTQEHIKGKRIFWDYFRLLFQPEFSPERKKERTKERKKSKKEKKKKKRKSCTS